MTAVILRPRGVLFLFSVASLFGSGDVALWKKGYDTVATSDLEQHERNLASPEMEGRDTPSAGLSRAADYIEKCFRDAGLEPLPIAASTGSDAVAKQPSMRFTYTHLAQHEVAEECSLSLAVDGQPPKEFALDHDFVPVPLLGGKAEGTLVFLGFGINAPKEHFEDAKGKELRGAIALIVEGEPRHPKLFEGSDPTRPADLWTKLVDLRDAGVVGVICVRRPPEKLVSKIKGPPIAPTPIGVREAFATWVGDPTPAAPNPLPPHLPPTIEVTPECAQLLLGESVEALAQKIDKSGKSIHMLPKSRKVKLSSGAKSTEVTLEDVVAEIKGTDPELSREFVVIGAHYDHIGVDARDRIGCGADDNASGSSALLELAQAFGGAHPRRSLLFISFSGEEKGLLGSQAFCKKPPIAASSMVAMVNMDMIGRGSPEELAVLGLNQNPELEKVLDRARKMSNVGVTKLVLRQGEELFQRSDHFSFHQIGVPVLFFFEGLPIEKNPDYHSWRDTVDKLDFEKMTRTTKMVFNTVWILANDDARPPRPK